MAAVFLLLGLVLSSTPVSFPLYLVAYLITMLPVFAKVAQNFAHGKYFDEYLLILVASLGAFLLRNYAEASVVLILHGVGKIASDLVLNSTHKSVAQQTPEVPEKASVVNMKEKNVRLRRPRSASVNLCWFAQASACRLTALCCGVTARWMMLR